MSRSRVVSRVASPAAMRVSWAVGVIAPWCLGAGMLVSITADAGQQFAQGATTAPLDARAAMMPLDLVPRASASIGGVAPIGTGRAILREARLAIGAPEEFHTVPDEVAPKLVLKPNVRAFPLVDRARKGDPSVGLRPSFDAKLRNRGGYTSFVESDMAFRTDENSLASTFQPLDGEAEGPDSVARFEPWGEGETPTTTSPVASGSTTPGAGPSVITVRPAAVTMRLAQGATPAVPRAVALGSTTPAPADALPLEVAVATGIGVASRPNMSVAPRSIERQAFAGQTFDARSRKCLSEAVYFEARSEPEDGQAAVAQVVLNRAASGLYPKDVCGVVYQNRHRFKACQFSFACEGKSLRITEQESWATAVRIANAVMDGRTYLSDVGGATHYHANYVRPGWSRRLKKMDTIGQHIFYSLKPGQT